MVSECEEKEADGEAAGGGEENEGRKCSQWKPDIVINQSVIL